MLIGVQTSSGDENEPARVKKISHFAVVSLARNCVAVAEKKLKDSYFNHIISWLYKRMQKKEILLLNIYFFLDKLHAYE